MSALGANRICRDGGSDVNDPERTCERARPRPAIILREQDELTVLPMLKLRKDNPRGCDAADCGLAQTARYHEPSPVVYD
jgi:hypothetical protein